MVDRSQLTELRGRDVHDTKGNRIGKVGEIYRGLGTDEPEWLGINTGLLGLRESLVPLRGVVIEAGYVQVDFDKDTVKNAPKIHTDDEPLSDDEAQRLHEYYELEMFEGPADEIESGGAGLTRPGRRLGADPEREELPGEKRKRGT